MIITEEDGMEVVSAMGENSVMLLQGHGAVTTGSNLEASVMNMLHLEEQSLYPHHKMRKLQFQKLMNQITHYFLR